MKKIFSACIVCSLIFAFPGKAHAIVLLPAVLLIPIVKLVAIVMASVSVPVASVGVLWSRLFGKKLPVAVAWVILAVLVVGLSVGIWAKISSPDRPLF